MTSTISTHPIISEGTVLWTGILGRPCARGRLKVEVVVNDVHIKPGLKEQMGSVVR